MTGSVMTSLLQPTPECFNLFDRLILMRNGSIIYDGPRESIGDYFYSIGIPIPDDQDLGDYISDFLTDPSMVYYRTLYRASRRAGQDLASASVTEETVNQSNNQAINQSINRAHSPAIQTIDKSKQGHVINVSSGELDPQSEEQALAQSMDQGNQLSMSKVNETLKLAQMISSPPLSTSALQEFLWLVVLFYVPFKAYLSPITCNLLHLFSWLVVQMRMHMVLCQYVDVIVGMRFIDKDCKSKVDRKCQAILIEISCLVTNIRYVTGNYQ